MKNLTNRVQIIGYAGKDVELVKFNCGKRMASFNVTTLDINKKNGQLIKRKYVHKVIGWNRMADMIAENINYGTEVIIEGNIVNSEYSDRDRDKTKIISEILVESLLYRKLNEVISENKEIRKIA